MLELLQMTRETRCDVAAIIRLCRVFGLTDAQTNRVLDLHA